MKCRLGLLAVIGLALVMASGAQATSSYTFTYTGDDKVTSGSGTVSGVDLGDGSLLVTSGSFTLTSSFDPGSLGTYSLFEIKPPANPANANTYSPSGLFYFDNLIYGANTPHPYVDTGLLFVRAGQPSELNIWGDGVALYTGNPGYPVASDHGTISLAPVPEPITFLSGLMVVSGLGAYMRRKTRLAKA